jgi:hypothetical protein
MSRQKSYRAVADCAIRNCTGYPLAAGPRHPGGGVVSPILMNLFMRMRSISDAPQFR